MTQPHRKSRFHTLVAVVLCFASGIVGSIIGRIYGAALSTSPAWIGPAILIGSLACFVAGLLLLPTAIRSFRAQR
ncbi:MAG: hypothetical protein K0M70_15760 [Arenimonas sp.]|uniref:hypothetical protein n=1 Tax=Arenimonas sp. TaxID=1872635 RepID=UPI0025C66037|nr:hypothetical protein [Arenimonas sp.]MBW8369298.1 hypothetical protein [Arenimonas sp.]